MNIKSLLLGSAAALAAVSGARAADAVVVAEPEPMEYVRVCDTYGAGFYYIPGTETCLKIGGLVRYQIDFSSDDDDADSAWFDGGEAGFDNGGWRKYARIEVSLNAKSETEYGTFGRYIVLRASTNSGLKSNEDTYEDGFSAGGNAAIQHAIISLGGLEIGLSDTTYDGALLGEYDRGGGDRDHFIRYTFDVGNGIALTAALEEADYNYDYVPNVVGRAVVTQGWGSVSLWGAYDATNEEGAFKVIAAIKASDAITLNLLGTYETGASFYSVDPGPGIGYEWSAAAEVKFQATDKLNLVVGGQYFADNHFYGGDDYSVGAVLNYSIVKNFNAKLAVSYADGDNYGDGVTTGFLRLDAGF